MLMISCACKDLFVVNDFFFLFAKNVTCWRVQEQEQGLGVGSMRLFKKSFLCFFGVEQKRKKQVQ
jgi:hypothetical protein